jgi:hypothetical protein
VAEGARLESVCAPKAYRGFESHLLRTFKTGICLSFFMEQRTENSYGFDPKELGFECRLLRCNNVVLPLETKVYRMELVYTNFNYKEPSLKLPLIRPIAHNDLFGDSFKGHHY